MPRSNRPDPRVPFAVPFAAALLACALLAGGVAHAEDVGGIQGRVLRDGRGIGGVSVVAQPSGAATLTDSNGYFRLSGLPAGSYSVVFTLGEATYAEEDVEVVAGDTTRLEVFVDWELNYAETITVFSASRRAERIVEAPQAISTVNEEVIEEQSSHGQVPKLLEFTPGAEVTQSGVYDFNFNTRGFNSSLNRRVATLIDGRDPSVPFLGAQEWAAVSFPLDDLASVEFARGPSAALYGANASSGVINMTTKQPRFSQGGRVRGTAGELSTKNLDLRYATDLGRDWFMKVTGGMRYSGDFSVSRNGQAEYSEPCTVSGQTDCLPQEPVPLAIVDDNEIEFGSLRFDKYFAGGSFLTMEGGNAWIQGPIFQTGLGRVQLVDVKRPWARANWTSEHWNVLAYYNKRDADEQLALSSGSNLVLQTNNWHVEARTNWSFADDTVRVVAGVSYEEEEIDTEDPQTGQQTLVFAPIDSDTQAAYAQVDWRASDKVKLVLAGRYDESSLHDAQFSPKAALVFTPAENHSIRLTYGEAFQVANYSEFFLQANVAPPVTALAPIEAAICTPNGVDCGFGGPVRVLALGNADLELEEITTYEVGYSGVLGKKTFLTLDVYRSDNENFITDLIPQVDAMGNRTNPNFGPYVPPAALPAPLQAALLAQLQANLPAANFAILTNNFDGSPIFGAVSYTNFGEVETTGVDLGLTHFVDARWSVFGTYSWFDFDIQDETSPFANQLQPNTPEHKVSLGFRYAREDFDVSLSGRWVDDFRWVVGPFQGDVESYETFDLTANYRFDDHWSVGLLVTNVSDNEHWEAFGGDILERRALASVAFEW